MKRMVSAKAMRERLGSGNTYVSEKDDAILLTYLLRQELYGCSVMITELKRASSLKSYQGP